MNRNHVTVLIFGFLSFVGISLEANAQTPQELITEIKMNPAYLTATGTSHSNGEAMKDARSRLKYEIFNWLTEIVPATSSTDAAKETYRNQIAKSVKLEEGYKRLTYTDTLNAYSIFMSQSDDVKFIDRKVGDYLRVFAYLPKSKVLPGFPTDKEFTSFVQEDNSSQTEEMSPSEIKISSYIEEKEIPVENEIQEENNTVKESQISMPEMEIVNTVTDITETPVTVQENKQQDQTRSKSLLNEEIVKELNGIKTAAELNAFMGRLKQSGKLGNYGNSLKPELTDCYIMMFDSHKVVRERLWYNGNEMINLKNGEKVDFTSLYDSYPNIIWFQTK